MSTLPFKVLKIHEYGVVENKRIPLDKVQKEYIKKKLSVLGDAVNIVDDNYDDGKAIAITYDISKDEYRWNLVHKQIKDREDKLNNAVSKIEISEPSLEAWAFMLKSFYNGKNPRIIFKKYKGNLD
jgi:CRISPR/Cas system-associated endoribonuclease Cas2